MSEGDSIFRLAARLERQLVGERVISTVVRDRQLAGIDFTGATLTAAVPVGKHLFVRFDDGRTLHVHLGLHSRLVIGATPSVPTNRRRLELHAGAASLAAVGSPRLAVISTVDEPAQVAHLGPDLLDPAVDVDAVTARLLRAPRTALAAALLEQRNAAGLGNVFAVEVPFIAGLHPAQPVGTVDGLDVVVLVAASLLRHSAWSGVRNTTGRALSRTGYWIYPKRGDPCPRCRVPVTGISASASPWRRRSFWCPRCQSRRVSASIDTDRVALLLDGHPARQALSGVIAPRQPTLFDGPPSCADDRPAS